MRKVFNNVKIISESVESTGGFNIVLDLSGKREFLVHHRRNDKLFKYLEKGVRLDELKRWRPSKQPTRRRQQEQSRLFNVMHHLIKVIDSYLVEEVGQSEKMTKVA